MYKPGHQAGTRDKIYSILIIFGAPGPRTRTRTRRGGVGVIEGGGLREPAKLHFMTKVATTMALPLKPTTPSGGRPEGIGIPVAPPS